jgi:phage-related minor tail protein
MDPISIIVAAVVAGAAAGVKDQAAQAVKDAYEALKGLLGHKHGVDVAPLERKPDSEAKQASLKEDLTEVGAAADAEVVEAARRLVAEVRKHDAAAARAVGVDIDDVSAEFVRISNIVVTGPGVGVDMDRVTTRGGVVVEGVHVDAGGTPPIRP